MNRKNLLVVLLILLFVISLIISLILGGTPVSIKEIWYSVVHPDVSQTISTIIYRIRLPRIIAGVCIGAGLSVCGCVLQAILRNPLAEPYTLGISGGASLGATIAVVLNFANFFGIFWLPIATFLGAFISVSTIYLIASKRQFSTHILILIGVILSFVFSSIVMFVFAIAKPQEIYTAIFWLMGDLSSVEHTLLSLIVPLITLGVTAIFLFNRELDIITLGEEKAHYTGLNVEKTKKILFVITSIVTAVCVSSSGIIGFVGLIVPHFIRYFVTGPKHKFLIPVSAISGAIFLILCDTLARTIIAPVELPVGVITGILGGMFFLTFFLRQKTII